MEQNLQGIHIMYNFFKVSGAGDTHIGLYLTFEIAIIVPTFIVLEA